MICRAKFKVDAIKSTMGSKVKRDADGQPVMNERGYAEREPCEMKTIELSPVYGNGDPAHENTKFWEASPSGQISLSTVNGDAAAVFELGREYYIDFIPAAKED